MTSTSIPNSGPYEVDEDGTVRVGAFDLPISPALSHQSRAMQLAMRRSTRPNLKDCNNEVEFKAAVDAFRKTSDDMARSAAERLLTMFPVNIEPGEIGGVPIETFTPHSDLDEERILINLHGGGFYAGAIYNARMESIPMAHKASVRVISVDYRQGYEYRFPAASEDVASVYTALLKEYAPRQIGIYGGSAGGILAAQATAWIIEHGHPVPGAIGVFSAGTGGRGDGAYFSAIGSGKRPPDYAMAEMTDADFGYFSGTRPDDYLVNPNIAPEGFRAQFPPTLIITGTRAFDFSPALATHRALIQAGVEAQLHVFDGLGHAFYYAAVTPEAADAYATMIRFFRKHLGC